MFLSAQPWLLPSSPPTFRHCLLSRERLLTDLVPHTTVSVKIVGALYCLLAFPMFMYKIWSVNSKKQHWESRRRGRREKTAFDESVPTIFVWNCSYNNAAQNVWQTWEGYYLCVLLWSSLNVTVFCLLQKHLFKGMWNFQQNYCHACQTRFPKSLLLLKSSCVRSLLFIEWPASKDLITTPLLVNLAHLNTHMVERVSLTSCRLTVWSKLNFIYLPKCGWQFPCNMPQLFRLFKR